MPSLMKLLTRGAILIMLALIPAGAAHAVTFCAPPFPVPNETPPNPDNPPCCGDRDCERCTASPVFAKTGVYTTAETDLQIPTNGFPLVVARSYESSHVVDGPLGYGWRSNLGARIYYATYLFAAPSTFWKEAVVVMPDGESFRYRENADGSFTPPVGRRDTLAKLGDGTFQLTLERSNIRYSFAADGALLTIKDDYGNTLRFTHDATRRITAVQDDSGTGRSLSVTWNPSGRIASVQDNSGRVVSYSYGTNGTLAAVTNPAGHETTYTYEQRRFAPQLTQIKDHWNRTLAEVSWDSLDRVATYSEEGESYSMSYGPTGVTKTHSEGAQSIVLDANGLVTSRGGETMSYTADGDLTSAGGAQYTYTSGGRVSTVHYGGDVLFQYTYDATYPDQVARVEPRMRSNPTLYHGHWLGWKYTYYTEADTVSGALPRALRQIDRMAFQHQTQTVLTEGSPAATYAQFSYDAKGRVTRSWDRTAGETTYVYDDAARKIHVGAAFNGITGRTTTYAFDTLGRTTSVTDPLGNVTSYEYDVLDRTTKVTLPKPKLTSTLNFVTSFSYDQAGTSPALTYTHATDPNSRVTKQGYDAFGRLVESIDALGNTTRYGYSNGLLASITDANGNVTSYEYDTMRRLKSTTFPDGKTESYTYLADGKLQSKTDRKGVTTSYQYDAYGRITTQTTGAQSRVFTYEGEKLFGVSDSYSGTTDAITYTYDPKTFLPLTERQGIGTGRGTIDYTWGSSTDWLSSYKVSDASSPVNDTQTVTYAYFADGSVRTISWSRGPGTYSLAYNGNGQQTAITFPNGQTRNFTYDNQGRLTRLTNLRSGANLGSFDYEYDKDNVTGQFTVLGQRTKASADVPALAALQTITEYFYDANYQLTRAKRTSPTVSDNSWTYDAIGNRLTQSAPATSYTYVKNSGNTKNSSRLATAGSNSVSHDVNGNITTFLGTYTWDVLDRLKTRNTGTTYTFTYDAQDRRTGISHQATKFLYRGLDPVTMGYTKGGGYYRSDYLFGPGIDEPLARTDHQSVTYYTVDGLGSVVLLTDGQGTVKNKYNYGPWGEIQTASETLVQPFAYTGREFAVLDTGVVESHYYYRARYMIPAIGRFLSEDPLRFESGDINPYRYAVNDPVVLVDPLGLRAGCRAGEPATQACTVGPRDAWRARDLAREASDAARRSGLPGAHNGPQDAFRHCYWSCRMAQEIGRDQAQEVGDVHERCVSGPPNETRMDQHNNALGRALGRRAINCYGVCLAAVRASRTRNSL